MTVIDKIGVALGFKDEPVPDAPAPEMNPMFAFGAPLFDPEKSIPPLIAGKCVSGTKPNAVQPPAPIEFIHYGYLHRSMANLYKHPSFPEGDEAEEPAPEPAEEEPADSGEPEGELFKNPLFRKQAIKNKADWIKSLNPNPDDSALLSPEPKKDEEEADDAEESDAAAAAAETESQGEETARPAGQAILMRDALLRESLLLRGCLDSTMRGHKDWKDSKSAITLFLFHRKAPKARRLIHVKQRAAKFAQEVNAETAEYPKIHETGLELHRARFQYRQYRDADLRDYYGKPSKLAFLGRLLFSPLNIVPGLGIFCELTSDIDGIGYAVQLDLCKAMEPWIEYQCDQLSLNAIRNYRESTFDLWYRPEPVEDPDAAPPGQATLGKIFEQLLSYGEEEPEPTGEKKEEPADEEPESFIKPAPPPIPDPPYAVVADAMRKAVGRKKLPRTLSGWFTLWTRYDIQTLEKLYTKLLEQTKEDRGKKITKDFVTEVLGRDLEKKFDKVFDLLYGVVKLVPDNLDSCLKQFDKLKKSEESEEEESKAKKEESDKLQALRVTRGWAPPIPPAAPGADMLQSLAKGAEGSGSNGELAREVREQQEEQQQQKDLETLQKLDEEAVEEEKNEEPKEEDSEEAVGKKISEAMDRVWKAAKKKTAELREDTIKSLAECLEEARKEAHDADALTMEVYLGRLPYLLATLLRTSSLAVWRTTFMTLLKESAKEGYKAAKEQIDKKKKDKEKDGEKKEEGEGAAKDEGEEKKDEEKDEQSALDKVKELVKGIRGAFATKQEPEEFPPQSRVVACAGAQISRDHRVTASEQVDRGSYGDDPAAAVFLKVEAEG